MRSVWTQVEGLRVHAVATGAGPPVVLVPGYGLSGTYMRPLARSLSGSFAVFVPDLPGQGRSDELRRPGGIAELADVLGAWLDAAGLDRPAFVANSLGCQIVTELAVRRPARVGPMVLVGPTVDPARRAARRQLLCTLRDSAREPLALVALAARDNAGVGRRTLLATARSALADRIEERLPLIEQPTVVVHGADDGFIGREWAEEVASLLPRGRLVVVAGEAHAVHYTRPAFVAGIVRELVLEEREADLDRYSYGDVAAANAHALGAPLQLLPLPAED